MRMATYLVLLISAVVPIRAALGDWLVIESSASGYEAYQLLPEGSRIDLVAGEQLQLLHDDGTQRTVEGPATVNLNSPRSDHDRTQSSQAGLATRLATLFETPNRMEIPLTTRGATSRTRTSPMPEGAIDINSVSVRCISDDTEVLLARNQAQAMNTADVQAKMEGGKTDRITWHAGFSTLRNECPMSVGLRMQPRRISDALQKDLDRISELWSEGLQRFGGEFLAGERFTAVDAFYCPVAFRIQSWRLKLDTAAAAYAERLLNLPGMQAWATAALVEPYREPSHEAEFAALGDIVEDLRSA